MLCSSAAACAQGALVLGLLGLTQGAIVALNAVALTLVYGATRAVSESEAKAIANEAH